MPKENQHSAFQALSIYTQDKIQDSILSIRGQQIIMDADLAKFYQVRTIALNQAVKRNEARFPERYRFQLTEEEKSELITNCDRFKGLKHSPYLPYAFTEQGITQLSAVLHSDIAIEMSIRINDAFHAMRKFIINNAGIFQRLEAVELKQICTDKRIDQILNRLDDGRLKAKLGIFFDGHVYHFGASLKDLGKKWFSVDIITEQTADDLIARL